MSADIVDIKAAKVERANGNGAREAMAAAILYCLGYDEPVATEGMLMRLWELGFKVVPLNDGET